MEKSLKKIFLLIAIFILIAINLWIFINNSNKKKGNNEPKAQVNEIQKQEKNTKVSETKVEEKEKEKTKIASMDEISRVRVYCGKFIEAIEDKDYQQAYDYLNVTYKANYFPTLEEFSNYIKEKYPQNGIVVKYNSVEKKGEVFVLDITVYDEDNIDSFLFSQSIVIREIEANNFSLSFSKDDERSGRSRE